MKHLLVPIDFSEYAYNACTYALRLASKYNARVTLVHAYHIPIVDPLMPSEYLSDLATSAEREITNSMTELKGKLGKYAAENNISGYELHDHITMGFAVDEIINISEQLEPDMIIMGRRFTEGMAKILLGSITSSVLEKAAFPVLIVPENITKEKLVQNVLYASEYDEADIETIEKLLEITKPLNAKIHCVHVSLEASVGKEQKKQKLEKTYSEAVAMRYIEFVNISSDKVMEGLSAYIEQNNIDLMAMLTHERSFLMKFFDRSLTQKVAYNTNIPLLVFHENS